MNVIKTATGTKLILAVEGRVDTSGAPILEAEVTANIDGKNELVFNFSGVEYISSAGLRVLLKAQNIMNKQGKMVVTNVNEEVMDVLELTGFTDFLTIE